MCRSQLLFLSGVMLIIGPSKTYRFFFQKRKAKGTACFLGGIALVLYGWAMVGIIVEGWGFLNLFGDFFPTALYALPHKRQRRCGIPPQPRTIYPRVPPAACHRAPTCAPMPRLARGVPTANPLTRPPCRPCAQRLHAKYAHHRQPALAALCALGDRPPRAKVEVARVSGEAAWAAPRSCEHAWKLGSREHALGSEYTVRRERAWLSSVSEWSP